MAPATAAADVDGTANHPEPDETTEHAAAVQPVAPFKVSFDYEDDHCSRELEDVRYDLLYELEDNHPGVAALLMRDLSDLDKDDAHELLDGYADDLEEMISDGDLDDDDENDELLDELRRAAASLTWCQYGCTCASDAFDHWGEEMLNELLTDLGDQLWAVSQPSWRGGSDPEPDIDAVLDVERLYTHVGSRDGWTRCTLEWDGTSLTASFLVYRGGTTELVLTPLTDAQKQIHAAWSDSRTYADNLAAHILAADPAVLDRAYQLWSAADDPEELYEDFEELLRTVTELGADALRELDTAVVARLAPSWTASLPELLSTSLSLMGGHVTGFAA